MKSSELSWITNFIWGIADDVLRDLYVRGKYRDVILPMVVIRRLDAVLEGTKKGVLEMKASLDEAGVTNQDQALRQAAGEAFYNTSKFTLRDLRHRASQQNLRDDFIAYLDGFSPNVQEIISNFDFRHQVPKLSRADALGTLIEKFLDPAINLSPKPVLNGNNTVKHPGLDNHAMGTVFEELVRRFNEDNNEEAGEHWTPRDAVRLMAKLIFLPIADRIESGTYLLYDGACGTGGMLTVAEETLETLANERGKKVVTHMFGQEINAETYAIAKADFLLKGEGDDADNLVGGPEHSTLSSDAFPSREFDFMLSNPPYGKSYKSDLERMGGKSGLKDPRFIVEHDGDPEFSLITRSSDGQMLFLANMVSKMKRGTKLGSRIAEVHNGSSLFTGDAGQGESNIRRWIIENDLLEAIVALPLNMFYNTGIATYIWVLSNRKTPERRGKIQLIDATEWYVPLRRNLGQKNCELSADNIERICRAFLTMEESEHSKLFENKAFGYWKVTVDRPLRLCSQLTVSNIESLRFASGDSELRQALYEELGEDLFENFSKIAGALKQLIENWGKSDDDEDGGSEQKEIPAKKQKKLLDPKTWARDAKLAEIGAALRSALGKEVFMDHNAFRAQVEAELARLGHKLTATEKKAIYAAVSWTDARAARVVKKQHRPGKAKASPLHGRFEATIDGKPCVVEYEHDPDLRDTEQVPLLEDGGIDAFIRREVLPYAEDAWYDAKSAKIGYEVSFTRHFYKPAPLRTLAEIRSDIAVLEKETEGLLAEIVGGVSP